MHTGLPAGAGETSSYDAQPWLLHYPRDVQHRLTYPDQSVWDLLEEVAAAHGDRPAYVFQGDSLTFEQVRAQSEQFSHTLASLGVQRGSNVLVMLPNVPHFPIAYYATLRLGAALAAISPLSVPREIEDFIRDSESRVVITLDLFYDKLHDVWQPCGVERVIVGTATDFMPWWKRTAAAVSRKAPRPAVPITYSDQVITMRQAIRDGRSGKSRAVATSSDVALLQYTGGTTGAPKAAMLTHANLLANARQGQALFPTLKVCEETIIGLLPFSHIYAVTLILNFGLLLAARTILIPRLDMGQIFESIRRYQATIFPGVPTLYVRLINDDRAQRYDMSSIEVCLSGGAPLPIEVKRGFERATGGHLYEAYGLSEASPLTHVQPHDESGKLGSIGLPVQDTEARIVNPETGEPVPVGDEGELVVRGHQIMRGYWKRPEDTANALRDGWLYTGDIARMDSDGYFFIVDRIKDLIITGGENIYPREIEEVLFEHPGVEEAAVVGVPHPYGGEIAKAFIVPKQGVDLSKQELTRFASERLSKHKVPRAFEFRDTLPKSTAGKVLRRVLKDEETTRQAERGQRHRGKGNAPEDVP